MSAFEEETPDARLPRSRSPLRGECEESLVPLPERRKGNRDQWVIRAIARALVGFFRHPRRRPLELRIGEEGGIRLGSIMFAWADRQGITEEEVLKAVREDGALTIENDHDGQITIYMPGCEVRPQPRVEDQNHALIQSLIQASAHALRDEQVVVPKQACKHEQVQDDLMCKPEPHAEPEPESCTGLPVSSACAGHVPSFMPLSTGQPSHLDISVAGTIPAAQGIGAVVKHPFVDPSTFRPELQSIDHKTSTDSGLGWMVDQHPSVKCEIGLQGPGHHLNAALQPVPIVGSVARRLQENCPVALSPPCPQSACLGQYGSSAVGTVKGELPLAVQTSPTVLAIVPPPPPPLRVEGSAPAVCGPSVMAAGAGRWDRVRGERLQRWLHWALSKGHRELGVYVADGGWAYLDALAVALQTTRTDFPGADVTILSYLLSASDGWQRFEERDGRIRKRPDAVSMPDRSGQGRPVPTALAVPTASATSPELARSMIKTEAPHTTAPQMPPGEHWTKYVDNGCLWWHYKGPLGQWWCTGDATAPQPYRA